jgi:hypothetical protein
MLVSALALDLTLSVYPTGWTIIPITCLPTLGKNDEKRNKNVSYNNRKSAIIPRPASLHIHPLTHRKEGTL